MVDQANRETANLDVGSDQNGRFHFLAYPPGVKNARAQARSLCGQYQRADLRIAAFFDIGEPRGQVYYESGCDECLERLKVATREFSLEKRVPND